MNLSQVRKLPNEKIIELIKSKKIDININNQYGNLLFYADADLSEFLLKNGINKNFVNNKKRNAFFYAALFDKRKIDVLIKYDVDMNLKNFNNDNVAVYTIYLICDNLIKNKNLVINNFKYMLSKGLQLNEKWVFEVPEHFFAFKNVELFSFLLKEYVNVNEETSKLMKVYNPYLNNILNALIDPEYRPDIINDEHFLDIVKIINEKGYNHKITMRELSDFILLPKTLNYMVTHMQIDTTSIPVEEFSSPNLHIEDYIKNIDPKFKKLMCKRLKQSLNILQKKVYKNKSLKSLYGDNSLRSNITKYFPELLPDLYKKIDIKKINTNLYPYIDNIALLNKLIKTGFEVDRPNANGDNILFYEISDDIFDYIFDNFRSAIYQKNNRNQNCTFRKMNLYQLKKLHSAGVNLNIRDTDGLTCLYYQTDKEVFQYLLENGCPEDDLKNGNLFMLNKSKAMPLESLEYLILEKKMKCTKILNSVANIVNIFNILKILIDNNIDYKFIDNFTKFRERKNVDVNLMFKYIEIRNYLKEKGKKNECLKIEKLIDEAFVYEFMNSNLHYNEIKNVHKTYKKLNNFKYLIYNKLSDSSKLFHFDIINIYDLIENYDLHFTKDGELPNLKENSKVNKMLQENFYNYLINRKIGKEKKQIIKKCGILSKNKIRLARI